MSRFDFSTIPADKFEQNLTDWISRLLHTQPLDELDTKSLGFLLHLSKAQMIDRGRGDDYPFIEEIHPSLVEYQIIDDNGWLQSENLEIKAYCLDVCASRERDKRVIKREASDAYFNLYKKTRAPWYLVRSVIVRFYIVGEDEEYLKKLCQAVPFVHGNWLIKISEKLYKDCKSDLSAYSEAMEKKMTSLVTQNRYYDAEPVLDALYILRKFTSDDYHLRKALLLEAEFDYLQEKQRDNEYILKEDQIQRAYNEIYSVKQHYPKIHNRIREKLITEKRVFVDTLHTFGAKNKYNVPNSLVISMEEFLTKNPINSPIDLLSLLCSIKFPSGSVVKSYKTHLVKADPMLYLSFGRSTALGENGQTIGKANPEESLTIESHKRLRALVMYRVTCCLEDFNKHGPKINEEELGQDLIDGCNASYIEESRKCLWAKGIIEGCRDDMISASHILMPQIERALVWKAQYYCGDLTHYERERHDQINLDTALEALKPYLKGVLYDEFSYFFTNGADVNLRNRLAHGLIEPYSILQEGVYLWWLAIKMFFCEGELFLKQKRKV